MVTEYLEGNKKCRLDWDDAAYARLEKAKEERDAKLGDTYRASLYFSELKRLRELTNLPIGIV